jgi:hypothetical protein
MTGAWCCGRAGHERRRLVRRRRAPRDEAHRIRAVRHVDFCHLKRGRKMGHRSGHRTGPATAGAGAARAFVSVQQRERDMSEVKSTREANLERLLADANGLIRSFSAVCDREGRETNWDGLKAQVRRALADQHQWMNPEQYATGPREG